MSLLSASEVLQFAVRIEENGQKFYQAFEKQLSKDAEKEIFRFLAEEEAKHIKIFNNMLDKAENFKPELSYPDQYFAYLQVYADNLVFADTSLEKEVSKIADALKAVEFGIRRELDSILYYQEIKSFVPSKERTLIDNVIGEERSHFLKLSALKKEL
jgi:rubrerythrin